MKIAVKHKLVCVNRSFKEIVFYEQIYSIQNSVNSLLVFHFRNCLFSDFDLNDWSFTVYIDLYVKFHVNGRYSILSLTLFLN